MLKKKHLIICNLLQLVVGPLLSIVHVYCVIEEMRATPVNTLNPQRTAMLVADFIKVCLNSLYLGAYVRIYLLFFVQFKSILDGKSIKPC